LVAVPADEIEVPFTAVKRLLFRVVSSIPQFAEFVEHIIGKLLGAARRFVHDFPRPDAVVTVGLVLLSALLRAVTTVSFIYLGEAQWLTFDPASTSFFSARRDVGHNGICFVVGVSHRTSDLQWFCQFRFLNR